jgi:glycosyltransferase involved in cell wall biosynthesis
VRVLHVVHQYMPEHIGGTELYTRWLADGLSRRGHKVAIFYRRNGDGTGLERRVDPPGIQVWAVTAGPMTPSRRFLATFGEASVLAAFQQVVVETRPDLVHLQHLMGLPVALVQYLQKKGIPFVITLHDYWWICANAQLFTNYSQEICDGPQLYLNCARCALARMNHPYLWPALPGLAGLLARRNQLLRWVMQAAYRLIAPSQFVADWYAAHGLPANRLRTIPHGSPLPTFGPRQERPTGRPFRFAYIGGLTRQKGVHALLEAFNGLEAGGELWVAGDETAEPAYVAHLRSSASPAVHFLGKLSRAAVWETLAQVDVLVVPSLWYETFAFVVSEAFTAGVPVIASRLGPLAERVQHGVDGLLVPPDDVTALRQAMRRFLQEPTLRSHLQAGIRPVQTIETHVDAITAIYEDILTETSLTRKL